MIVESLLEILTKRRSQTFYNSLLMFIHSVTNVSESTSSITMYNIKNQSCKHDFSCGSVVNNLKDRKPFFDQMNRNHFDPISSRRDWNCSTMLNQVALKLCCKWNNGALRQVLTVCSYHVICAFKSESAIRGCLNAKELFA